MGNWKGEILARINRANERRTEIHTALNSLGGELRVSPYNQKVVVDLKDEENLVWTVTIANESMNITETEVRDRQMILSDWGDPTGDTKDLKEALVELILEKFKP